MAQGGVPMDASKPRTTFPLRLATSLRERAEKLAATDGVSLNQFINLAVAEKASRLEAQIDSQPALVKKVQ
jgi:predicted HicB family RNase H-like nuclease